jgi:drug/metabolite transporter (DMT)-like permease
LIAVLFAALSGALFGAMTVAVRTGLTRAPDAEVGALVVAGGGAVVSIPVGIVVGLLGNVTPSDLWPYALAGALVPGCTQILFVVAVRDAGPSRAAILIGTAPLMSVAIALTLLGEPFHLLLVLGTVLVVGGGVVLARERRRPAHFRRLGAVVALICAALFAVRDNVVRWASRGVHAPPLAASAVALTAAALVVVAYLVAMRRRDLRSRLRRALPAFAPAGATLAVAYACLFVAFDRGSVSIVAPFNATQSLWAVVFSALVLGRATDMIGRRLLVAGLLVVAGAALIGIVR